MSHPFGARAQRASLEGFRCPYCQGKLSLQKKAPYVISAGRLVRSAFVNVCRTCDEHIVTEQEWQHLIEQELEPG